MPVVMQPGFELEPLPREARRSRRIEAQFADGDDRTPVTLHPNAAERYRGKVAQIHEALTKGDAASLEAISILRELIDHIEVTPTERPLPVELRVVGNLAALLVENTPRTGVALTVVAGVRIGRSSHRPRYTLSA
jgi:hypothetical protein